MATSGIEESTDPRALRRCFGRFATGVTVVTYRDSDDVRGATVNSFTSVSIEPPLLLVSLSRSTRAATAMAGRPFAVNVLREDQTDVALHFAGRTRSSLRLRWDDPVDDHAPSLSDAAAVFQCRPWQRVDAGDHVLELGAIVGFEHRQGDPLVFSDGRFVSTGLPLLDGPLVHSLEAPPAPGWLGAARLMHALAEH
jgi:flavin reductase (DIM6/NTAB) family NADH-FMN oxidoreductase RutF